jgi:hypothetical protein
MAVVSAVVSGGPGNCCTRFMALPSAKPQPATYEDILRLPENVVGEIIDGDLIASPRPAPRHALASSAIGGELAGPFHKGRGGPGGWIILDKPELHLDAQRYRAPGDLPFGLVGPPPGTRDSSGKANLAHALETAVLLDLDRRGAEVAYVRPRSGADAGAPSDWEVDFLARYPDGRQQLIQVCADLHEPGTRAREFRALECAAKEHPGLNSSRRRYARKST